MNILLKRTVSHWPYKGNLSQIQIIINMLWLLSLICLDSFAFTVVYADFPVPVGPTNMTCFSWGTRSERRAQVLMVSIVVTMIWLTGMSLGIGGARASSSAQSFHLPLPLTYKKYIRIYYFIIIHALPDWLIYQKFKGTSRSDSDRTRKKLFFLI